MSTKKKKSQIKRKEEMKTITLVTKKKKIQGKKSQHVSNKGRKNERKKNKKSTYWRLEGEF